MIKPWKHKPSYGVEDSYPIGMKWLQPCQLVEDWGCALCHAKTYRDGDYRGIDGTAGKADIVADLSSYRSVVDGVFMRHVLEHNLDWRTILDNALASFQKRMTLITFLPITDQDAPGGVPKPKPYTEITLRGRDLIAMIKTFLVDMRWVWRPEGQVDTVFMLEKS